MDDSVGNWDVVKRNIFSKFKRGASCSPKRPKYRFRKPSPRTNTGTSDLRQPYGDTRGYVKYDSNPCTTPQSNFRTYVSCGGPEVLYSSANPDNYPGNIDSVFYAVENCMPGKPTSFTCWLPNKAKKISGRKRNRSSRTISKN